MASSSGDDAFDKAALRAIQETTWRTLPAGADPETPITFTFTGNVE